MDLREGIHGTLQGERQHDACVRETNKTSSRVAMKAGPAQTHLSDIACDSFESVEGLDKLLSSALERVCVTNTNNKIEPMECNAMNGMAVMGVEGIP